MPAIGWMQKGPFGIMVHWCDATAPGPDAPNIGIYQDGSLAEQTLKQVKQMGELKRSGAKPEPINSHRRRYSS